MAYRCEDAPACGCGPEGCVDTSRTVSCEDCGKKYHPDQQTERFCYVCLSKPPVPKFDGSPAGYGVCDECGTDHVPADEEQLRRWSQETRLCEGCYEDYELGAMQGYDAELRGD